MCEKEGRELGSKTRDAEGKDQPWERHLGCLGNAIETGGAIDMSLYPEIQGAQSYLPGSYMPNYTLSPPTGLNIMGNPITVGAPTQLNTLVGPGMGNVNWAACLVCQ